MDTELKRLEAEQEGIMSDIELQVLSHEEQIHLWCKLTKNLFQQQEIYKQQLENLKRQIR